MTLTISKCKFSKQQHTITLNYTLGENEKSSLIFTLMICRNFFAHRNAVCKTKDGLAHLKKDRSVNVYVYNAAWYLDTDGLAKQELLLTVKWFRLYKLRCDCFCTGNSEHLP